ncbi:unnamed protein product, partial [Ectocarpus sp. 6 AP-2014]
PPPSNQTTVPHPHPRGPNPIRQTGRAFLFQNRWPIHVPRMCPQVGTETGQDQSRAPPPVARLFRRGRIGPPQGSQVAYQQIMFAAGKTNHEPNYSSFEQRQRESID